MIVKYQNIETLLVCQALEQLRFDIVLELKRACNFGTQKVKV